MELKPSHPRRFPGVRPNVQGSSAPFLQGKRGTCSGFLTDYLYPPLSLSIIVQSSGHFI